MTTPSKLISVLITAGLLILGAGWIASAKSKARLVEENLTLQASLQTAQGAQAKITDQRNRWEAEAERLGKQAEEVHQLRAEVSRLRNELAQKSAAEARLRAESKKAETRSAEEALQVRRAIAEKGLASQDGPIPLASAPAAVGATFLREMQVAPANGIFTSVREGKTVYSTKGQMPDGRGIALTVSEDGSILEKWADVPADAVPANVREIVSQQFGNLAIGKATEVTQNQRTRYELTARAPGSAMQVNVDSDGTLLSYTARFGGQRDEKVKK